MSEESNDEDIFEDANDKFFEEANDGEIFEDAKDEELLDKDLLDKILKKLNDLNFISILFLLLNHIGSSNYLYIINGNRIEKEHYLKNILQHEPKDLLIDLLWTIKRYDLLKMLNTCHHKLQHRSSSSSSLNTMWKSLYEVCDSMELESDIKYLKDTFKAVSTSDDESLEILIVKAYHNGTISKSGLEVLLNNLNQGNEISKTWTLHNEYLVRSPTVESPCGLAVIINHETFSCEKDNGLDLSRRKNSYLDVDALKKLWKSFGFEIQTYLNYTAEEILSEFENLSKKDFSSYDIFVTCYMSHGDEGIVYASDCEPISISCLIDYMANKCKTLFNKPKLFFIQACQGSQIQCGSSVQYQSGSFFPISSTPPDSKPNLSRFSNSTPLFTDVLVAVSSIPGFVSFASDGKNCWFIEALVDNMEQYGDQLSILDVLIKVNNHVSEKNGVTRIQGHLIKNCKQTVEQRHTLRKILRLKKLKTN